MKANMANSQAVPQQQQQAVVAVTTPSVDPTVANKQFVVTPDYIQQSMLYNHTSVIVSNPNFVYYSLQNDLHRQ